VPKRSGLTRATIARAALTLLDAEGLEAVTMRRLAAELDVSAMTLYSYVVNREALLDEVTQLVYGEIPAPDPDAPPREALRELMHASRRVLLAHPRVLPLISMFPPRTDEAMAYLEGGYRALRRAGVPPRDVARSYRALTAYSIGTAIVEISRYFPRHPVAGTADLDLADLADRYPNVAEVGPLLAELDDVAEFDYGLDLTLDGFLQRHLPG
jgi:AcrR family transcriptional regulator